MAHKNLAYESKEPAFLQRLRAQTAGVYQERPLNRPKKQRNPEDDEEDEPVYVLEDNSTLSGKEFQALKDGPKDEEPSKDDQEATSDKPSTGNSNDDKNRKTRDGVLEIGGKTQKRKIGKIVGAEASDEEEKQKEEGTKRTEDPPKKKKPKSKGKVKLSFGDD